MNWPEKRPTKKLSTLLWHGHLPTKAQLAELKESLSSQRQLPEGVITFLKSAPKKANPMDVIRTAISMLGLYDAEKEVEGEAESLNFHRAVSITAKIGVIAAYFHRSRQRAGSAPGAEGPQRSRTFSLSAQR